MTGPRPAPRRKADSLAKLRKPALDGWVATATAGGKAHLVPLSVAWDGERLLLAVEKTSRTFANLMATGRARVGLGPERDVVMVDAVVVTSLEVDTAPASVLEPFAAQADWDPRDAGAGYAFVVLAPERIQAWREADEIPDRTLMRHGRWVT